MVYVWSVLVYAWAVLVVLLLATFGLNRKMPIHKWIGVKIAVSVVAGVLIVGGISYSLSSAAASSQVNSAVSIDDAAELYGYDTSAHYPLSFGSDYYSHAVDFDDTSGYFSIYYDNARPLKSVALSFEKDGQSSLAIVQMSQISFTQDDSQDANIKLYFTKIDSSMSTFDESYEGIYTADMYSKCSLTFEYLMPTCSKSVSNSSLVMGKNATPVDLAKIFDSYIYRIDIILRPSQYNMLMS